MRFWLVRVVSVLLGIGAVALVNAVVVRSTNDRPITLVILAALYVVLAVSLNLVNGITGQFSLGHIAFYAVGAYTALANSLYLAPKLGLPPLGTILVSTVLGAVMAALAGLIVGLPSLRLKGDYLAIVTLGAGEIVRLVAQNQPALGGASGLSISPKANLVWLAVGLAVLTVAISRNLQTTARGLNFLAVREDEIAASAMGVNVTKVKVAAFVVASALAGAAGACFAHYNSFVSPAFFTSDNSILIVTMVVLGGTGSITGSVVAALLLFSVPEGLRSYPGTSMANVVGLLVAIVVATAGLKRVKDDFHGVISGRLARQFAVLGVAAVAMLVVAAVARNGTYFQTLVEGNKLRQVVPAITLVVMMLLRPQGIFGRAELSFGKLFGVSR